MLFALGGVYALYEGYHKISHPQQLTSPQIAIGVLVLALGLEIYALITAVKIANRTRRGRWLDFIKRAKEPELPTNLLEDAGAVGGLLLALGGVVLSALTRNGVFDGIATLLIGVLLVVIAVFLAIEMKSLLIGEAATSEDLALISAGLADAPIVSSVHRLRTMHLGPEELLVTASIGIQAGTTAEQISAEIDDAEQRIRAAVPIATVIYIEPDLDGPTERGLAPRSPASSDVAPAGYLPEPRRARLRFGQTRVAETRPGMTRPRKTKIADGLAWRWYGDPDPDREYLAMATYFELSAIRRVLRFQWYSLQVHASSRARRAWSATRCARSPRPNTGPCRRGRAARTCATSCARARTARP